MILIRTRINKQGKDKNKFSFKKNLSFEILAGVYFLFCNLY